MPRLLTAAKIAEGALQRIGAFSLRDEAPDPDELDVALDKLDLLVGEMAGTMTCYWLVPDEFTFTLTATTASYNLLTTLGSDYPEEGLQFPLSAYLKYPAASGGRRVPLKIARRREFLAHDHPTQPGSPTEVYIDRRDPPTLKPWPIIALPDHQMVLHYQTYSGDLTESAGARPHGMPAAWQRWAELATAADIGDGPVRRLKGDVLARLQRERDRAKITLTAFNNKEHSTRRPVAYRDF